MHCKPGNISASPVIHNDLSTAMYNTLTPVLISKPRRFGLRIVNDELDGLTLQVQQEVDGQCQTLKLASVLSSSVLRLRFEQNDI